MAPLSTGVAATSTCLTMPAKISRTHTHVIPSQLLVRRSIKNEEVAWPTGNTHEGCCKQRRDARATISRITLKTTILQKPSPRINNNKEKRHISNVYQITAKLRRQSQSDQSKTNLKNFIVGMVTNLIMTVSRLSFQEKQWLSPFLEVKCITSCNRTEKTERTGRPLC
ncbi:hypothetical protein TcasGA2_TC001244 [Tribolium castaneum]|uniref:Uncharacterized protein n=1 Tax=Tribolium castaneum TaxID=7070 RepID=D6WB79_TRICA|nr:hypothetical protein TcasGA2_TC001244 [Tribolium castaneum]